VESLLGREEFPRMFSLRDFGQVGDLGLNDLSSRRSPVSCWLRLPSGQGRTHSFWLNEVFVLDQFHSLKVPRESENLVSVGKREILRKATRSMASLLS
jgi:hypothetical protein